MQEATFLILTALADASQHGYGIITEVRRSPAAGSSCAPEPCTRRWTGCAPTG